MRALFLFALLAACSSHKTQSPSSAQESVRESTPVTENVAQADGPISLVGEVQSAPDTSVQKKYLDKWLVYFSTKEKSRFQRHLDRAYPYRDLVKGILVANGIPAEIFYLGIVESGYHHHARSHASAVGVWQFIRETGQRYGLKVNAYVDERRDVIRSTEAAAKYLKDLHNVFNSWELALAAYNAGEGRILRAVMRGKSRDYWTLLEKGVLPDETANYVPKFLAVAMIGENPESYGFEITQESMERPSYIKVPGGVPLTAIANSSGVPVQKLKVLNAHLMKNMTPPGVDNYPLWVPSDEEIKFKGVAQLTNKKVPALFKPVAKAEMAPVVADTKEVKEVKESKAKVKSLVFDNNFSPTKKIIVKRGETLFSLAQKHRTDITSIKRLNNLKTNIVNVGMRLFVPSAQAQTQKQTFRYRVKKGDSLTSIAEHFGVSVKNIQILNSLKRERVYAGEVLHVQTQRGI